MKTRREYFVYGRRRQEKVPLVFRQRILPPLPCRWWIPSPHDVGVWRGGFQLAAPIRWKLPLSPLVPRRERIHRNENSRVETPEPRENIERPTSNTKRRSERGFALPFDVRRWMFDVQCSSGFMGREHLQKFDVSWGHERWGETPSSPNFIHQRSGLDGVSPHPVHGKGKTPSAFFMTNNYWSVTCRKARPGRAPVCLPWSMTIRPLTMTYSTPSLY